MGCNRLEKVGLYKINLNYVKPHLDRLDLFRSYTEIYPYFSEGYMQKKF